MTRQRGAKQKRAKDQPGNSKDIATGFQEWAPMKSGIDDDAHSLRGVFHPGYRGSLKWGRQEAFMRTLGAIKGFFVVTRVKSKDIRISVTSCGTLNTTPPPSSMVVNHIKSKHNIHSLNLGGMGVTAGIIVIDLAKGLLDAYALGW
ncbi:hypothetical protein VNO77_23373 [Canavalia gladiata]|uniref:FAE domain-containing protein n=1 Tax=Canavalia gladiata TaxID=3824 RepID=A0AAN9QBM9_CANGL